MRGLAVDDRPPAIGARSLALDALSRLVIRLAQVIHLQIPFAAFRYRFIGDKALGGQALRHNYFRQQKKARHCCRASMDQKCLGDEIRKRNPRPTRNNYAKEKGSVEVRSLYGYWRGWKRSACKRSSLNSPMSQ